MLDDGSREQEGYRSVELGELEGAVNAAMVSLANAENILKAAQEALVLLGNSDDLAAKESAATAVLPHSLLSTLNRHGLMLQFLLRRLAILLTTQQIAMVTAAMVL